MRRPLAALLRATPPDQSVLRLRPEELAQRNIQALALDFDGVLAPHGAGEVLPDVADWLAACCRRLGPERVLILSNRPTPERRLMLERCFPGVRLISGVRKKPYVDGLIATGELAGVPLSGILMVDDRLLTGCLAALRAGAIPFYVRAPFVKLRHNLLPELFFMALRLFERWYVRLIG
ncbi:hypothetical protein [Trichlorobacter ammonificans]|uniref:Uncharacterized protein n=1 Tax=Trichlorobacter ammonificans TaxID=2916410 RepID=A0ABN8HBM6_9BACT|nr:hypothetical protein [Trichlorobacter ammonificans]CAH2030113.1 conserved protein of unknown function [Trichlorobacter ammonificans]